MNCPLVFYMGFLLNEQRQVELKFTLSILVNLNSALYFPAPSNQAFDVLPLIRFIQSIKLMLKNYRPVFIFLLLFFCGGMLARGQERQQKYALKLRTAELSLPPSFDPAVLAPNENEVFEGKYYRLIQFFDIPTVAEKEELSQRGLRLLDYLPQYAYFAEIDQDFDWKGAGEEKFRMVIRLDERIKLHPDLYAENFPDWAVTAGNELLVNVVCFPGLPFAKIKADLQEGSLKILEAKEEQSKFTVQLSPRQLSYLVNKPYVYFIEPIDEPAKPENYSGRTLHRSNSLAGDYSGSRKYDGTGIAVGMHDDGIIGPHIDYEGRIPVQYTNGNSGDHGDHVAGTIMGAGNLDPQHKGMAFGSDLFVYGSSNNNYDSVPAHYVNHNVIITSKSYSNGCNAGYTSLSRELDRYVRQHPSLMHVFSAGNDGTSDCGYGAGSNWGNITGGHKAGKNVITVANLNSVDALANSSSRGPAEDGRIKPDISAKGTSVTSTTDANDYTVKSGTSMSCPGVSGSLAQLYHAYRELNGGSYPPSGLMKGLMLNTADDIGNPGPDFKHGYGRINNLRAVEALENTQYYVDLIDQNDSLTHSVFVPVGVKQLKVMVYWNDFEASSSAAIALVNNLDLTLTDPSMNAFLPWVLDHTPNPSLLNANAVRGVDDLNNMEQVTIDDPVSGTYTASVKGKLIPQGPQEYFLVYSFVMDEVRVTYPNGGEPLVPGESEYIRWDAPETPANFTIDYSDDNGATWNMIVTVSNTVRHYLWTVPSTVSGTSRIRVSSGALSDVSDTSFSIIGVPGNLEVLWSCPDSIRFAWTGVLGATTYEASMLGNKYMDSAGTTAITSVVLHGISPTETKWLSVKALGPNNTTGRRAVAIEKPLGTFNCPIQDDVALGALVTPAGSLPDCKDISSVEVSVVLKNEGTNPVSNIPLNYQLNNSPVVTGVYAGPLPSGDSVVFSFVVPVDVSVAGNYDIVCWTSLSSDDNQYNDSTYQLVTSYNSLLVQLPWSEDFESFSPCGIENNCGATDCDLANGWLNLPNDVIDDIDWRTDNGGTRTDDTGPEQDHNPGNAFGNYLYTEASGGCDFKEALLLSPCIDLSTAVEPELTFWHHMYGQDMGSMHIDVLYREQWFTDLLMYQGTRGNLWRESKVDLTPFAGDTITIRFRGETAQGPYGDMAIDDISVVETSAFIGIEVSGKTNVDFHLYPNPSDGKVYLMLKNLSSAGMSLTITDLSGREVYRLPLNKNGMNSAALDLSFLEGGIYLVQLNTAEGPVTKKLVLN